MKETGRILRIQGTRVTVKAGEIGACFGCMNQECKSNERVFSAENSDKLILSEGDMVEIDNPAAASLLQALGVLAPPAAVAVLGYFAAGWLFPQSQEPAKAAAAVGGLFLGFLGMYWFRKAFPPRYAPRVTRKLDVDPAGVKPVVNT